MVLHKMEAEHVENDEGYCCAGIRSDSSICSGGGSQTGCHCRNFRYPAYRSYRASLARARRRGQAPRRPYPEGDPAACQKGSEKQGN